MLLRLENAYNAMTSGIRQVERVANNLANANTVGYRQDRMFTAVLEEEINDEGAPMSARRLDQWVDTGAGSFEWTENPLDVAIKGPGFFALQDPKSGENFYTRAGQFVLDEEGVLRNSQGYAVQGQSGEIQLPPEGGDIEIRMNGKIFVDGQAAGQLQIVQFNQPAYLTRAGGANFLANGQEPIELEEPNIAQGQLELSNVNTIAAMAELIEHARMFEAQQKTMQTVDRYLQRTARDLARL